MITQEDLYALAKDRPEMMRAFYSAVNAIIEYRKELAANQSGLWAVARLKKKQLAATFQTTHFPSGIVFNGQPISEEEKKLVQNWIVEAANFHMLTKEEQDKQLVRNVDALRESKGSDTATLPTLEEVLKDLSADKTE
jgi:hypothetical protein